MFLNVYSIFILTKLFVKIIIPFYLNLVYDL